MNVGIGTEAAKFPEKEYINGISLAVWTVLVSSRGLVLSARPAGTSEFFPALAALVGPVQNIFPDWPNSHTAISIRWEEPAEPISVSQGSSSQGNRNKGDATDRYYNLNLNWFGVLIFISDWLTYISVKNNKQLLLIIRQKVKKYKLNWTWTKRTYPPSPFPPL